MKKSVFKAAVLSFLIMTMASTTVFGKELVDSTPSSSTDLSAGEDVTQDKKTEYENSGTITTTTYEADNDVSVYATASSRAVISIPRTIIMGRVDDTSSYVGEYIVSVEGDISGSQKIVIRPEVTTEMEETGGKASKVTVATTLNDVEELKISANDLLNGNIVTAKGKITADGITAGRWKCGLVFHTRIENE
jgi:hypothetical protein